MSRMPKTMMAAVMTQLRAPLELVEVEMPAVLGIGQVLVRIHFSGICGSQLGEIDGGKGDDKYLPHLLGHEASGTVLDVGGGVRHVRVGDKVVLHWRKGQGIESETPIFGWKGRRVNAGWITTFNEYAIVSENRVTAVHPDSDMEVAALFGCAVTTGFGVVENNAKVRVGESVVVFGSGGVGLSVIQAAALSSAYPIIAVDRFGSKLPLAAQLGASHLIDSGGLTADHVGTVIEGMLDALGLEPRVDVFIDNTGVPEIIELGYRITKSQGRLTLVGVPRKGRDVVIHSLPLHFGKRILGSHGGESVPQTDIPRLSNLFRAGRLSLHPMITNRFRLDEINLAIAGMRSGSVVGRCLIAMGDAS